MLNNFSYLSLYIVSSDYSYYIKYKAIQDSENHAGKKKKKRNQRKSIKIGEVSFLEDLETFVFYSILILFTIL